MSLSKTLPGMAAILAIISSFAGPALAVCPSGQMAVGTEYFYENDQGSSGTYYSGFLMANDCGLISQNGLTQAANQMCNGDYNSGASVYCSDGWDATSAIDTQGNYWTCYSSSDSSCNNDEFRVSACCYRG